MVGQQFFTRPLLGGVLLVLASLGSAGSAGAGPLAGSEAMSPQAATQSPQAPPSPLPDDRYKADILVIVAHPDDETEITGYLAKAIFDEHKRVAVVFGTRGDAGGNAVGYEQAAALGAEREIEARRALAFFGVMNVWFLGGPDTPGQDVLRSLETWNHGAALAKAVRLVRLTRPQVILTWLPDYVVGENHGDHQAAAVIATEAFDLAGNPTVFPEQVAFPRDRNSVGNLTEGLRPWQVEKIYYFSDATHTDFLKGQGPEYTTTQVSPSRRVPYYRLAAEEMNYHLTQGDTGQVAKKALASGDFREFEQPVMLVLGKSLVGGSLSGDILENVAAGPIPFAPVRGYRPSARQGLSLALGGPWEFYHRFWRAHNLDHLRTLLAPEAGIPAGGTLHVPLLIRNDAAEAAGVTLTASLPAGWVEKAGSARYPVRAHDVCPVEAVLVAPARGSSGWSEITWNAESGGRPAGSVALRLFVGGGGLPQ